MHRSEKICNITRGKVSKNDENIYKKNAEQITKREKYSQLGSYQHYTKYNKLGICVRTLQTIFEMSIKFNQ